MVANDFDELIETAQGESRGSRLLLVLLQIDPAAIDNAAEAPSGGGGSLMPVLANDIELAPKINFASIVKQADHVGLPWDMIMVAILSDPTGNAPTSQAAEPHLKKMADDIMRGGDLSRYAVFDRAGNRLMVGRRH